MFLMIDNYDSFVYNLVRYLEELDEKVLIYRNDKISLDEIRDLSPQGIILSPGPKEPKDAGISLDIIREFKGEIPIMGVCLGHQAIGYVFGGSVVKAKLPMHGRISEVTHDGHGLFARIANPFKVTRYHSLVLDEGTIPDCLEVTCKTQDSVIMGIRHKTYCIEGVQFHPEAEQTEYGHQILYNFIEMCKRKRGDLCGDSASGNPITIRSF